MKIKLAIAAAAIAATLPMFASAQGAPNRPLTDAQRSQLSHTVLHQVRSDAVRRGPIAYGYINTDGSIASGSGNFSASWVPAEQWYAITIKNVNYYYSSFSTVVTYSIPTYTGAECSTDSVNGNLLVECFSLSGAPVQAAFGFITF